MTKVLTCDTILFNQRKVIQIMDIRRKIELEEKNFQHYIDLGVYDSEDVVYGEVSEIIDRIRKRDFSAMDNLIWHYTRITLLNELLDEEK